MPPCCLVIPCFNEEQRLNLENYFNFLRANSDYYCLFVDDGSSDRTVEVLNAAASDLPQQIGVLELSQNGGKAEAVRNGMLHAKNTQGFEFVGFIDADLSAPLGVMTELKAGLSELPSYNCAFGSRVRRMGANIERKFTRHFLGRVFATLSTKVLGIVAYDSQCGAKLFRREVIEDLFTDHFVSNWFFDLEIILRAGKKGIVEVPISEWKEVGGSKIKPTDFLTAPFEILKIKKHYGV